MAAVALVLAACVPTENTAPTRPPSPSVSATPTGQLAFRGSGDGGAGPFELTAPTMVAQIVTTARTRIVIDRGTQQGGLVDRPVPYQGRRPLAGAAPVRLIVTSAGNWSIVVTPIEKGAIEAFSGSGDDVSKEFDPSGRALMYEFAHEGGEDDTFFLQLHCRTGSPVFRDQTGPFHRSVSIVAGGPCYWEVRATARWSITPR